MKRLMTHDDAAKYRRWLASRSTAWLTGEKARLKSHPDFYNNGWVIARRLDEIETVLADREDSK